MIKILTMRFTHIQAEQQNKTPLPQYGGNGVATKAA